MADFIYFMHNDVTPAAAEALDAQWPAYFEKLNARGCFRGGSEIGQGKCFRKNSDVPRTNDRLVGYIRIEAAGLSDAEALLEGNPVYEAGGTVEIRELPVNS